MSGELHERARLLVDRSMVEGISAEEQRWLTHHLADCAGCGAYADLSRRAVRALQAFAFDVDAAGALRAQEAIRVQAGRRRDFSKGVLAALVLTAFGSTAVWIPAGWLAARWNLPACLWQTGFAIFWLLPSVMLTALLLFRRRLVGRSSHEGDAI